MGAGLKNIVILTGAGVSAESGLSTFRDAGGIWAKYDYREVATPEGFAANPALVHEFYNWRRRNHKTIAPNDAHFALAKLEAGLKTRGGAVTIVTQNVDGLHEQAGSENVLHMHGEMTKATCAHCGEICAWEDDLSVDLVCARCNRAGGMRPYVVWFGEVPHFLEETVNALMGADLFCSIGTSGSVYPAAGFVAQARELGVRTMELNLEPSGNAYLFDDSDYGRASEIVPKWVEAVLGE